MSDDDVPKDAIKDVLVRARSLVRDKWIKNFYFTYPGDDIERDEPQGCCAMGAVAWVLTQDGEDEAGDLGKEAEYCLMAELPSGFRSVESYNDAPSTTREEVLALFDRAIGRL